MDTCQQVGVVFGEDLDVSESTKMDTEMDTEMDTSSTYVVPNSNKIRPTDPRKNKLIK